MIPKKEFYFIRHGQTDHNLHTSKTDHYAHIPLNETGRSQAIAIEPKIAVLPVRTVCSSPYLRVRETRQLITPRLSAKTVEIDDLGECTHAVWQEMYALGPRISNDASKAVQNFAARVLSGLQQALAHEGPTLIVAHGGVHWIACYWMNIEGDWRVDNCVPIHFSIGDNGQWVAKKL
jgi:probable phosphoglycerate mutase